MAFAAAFALLLLLPSAAWAKRITLAWKPEPGAISYEISVEHEAHSVLRRKINATIWKGELKPGVYDYSIRAYDRAKRPGAWSPPRALVVMPKSSPKPMSPEDGDKIVTYAPHGQVVLKWQGVGGAKNYRVQVSRGNDAVLDRVVNGTQTKLDGVLPGKYHWKVSVEYRAGGRSPASISGRSWEGKPGESAEFTFDQKELKSPELDSPEGAMRPPKNGKMEFRWEPVEGAEAYEIDVAPKRMRLDQPAREVKWIVRSTRTVASISKEGDYTWGVRALASIDSKQVAQAVGAQSTTEFKLDRNAGMKAHSGYVAISTMVAPYHYNASSPGQNSYTQGNLNSTAVSGRLSGEYWFTPQFGGAFLAQDSSFTINGDNFDRKDIELQAKYRMTLNESGYPWTFIPKIGWLARQYVLLTLPQMPMIPVPGPQSMNSDQFMTLGPDLGFDLRKQFSERFSLGLQFAYYFPILSTEGSIQRGGASNRNFGLGLQGLYWLDKTWGLGAGLYVENRSISNINPSRTTADTIYMDGNYFFGSLVYSFGR